MNLNVENLVRSAVVVAVGLPVALSLANLTGTASRLAEQSLTDPTSEVTASLKSELAGPCVRYMLSKADSKLEREAKNDIEEVVGGPVNYTETCKWVL